MHSIATALNAGCNHALTLLLYPILRFSILGIVMGFLIGLNGRIGRRRWWLGQLLVLVILIATIAAAGVSLDFVWGLPAFAVERWPVLLTGLLATTTINASINVKRYHDRGKSGAWFFICFIPFVGAIWQLIELGFLRGQDGPNKYDGDSASGRTWGSDFGSDAGYASFADIDAKIEALKNGIPLPASNVPDSLPVTRMNTRLPQGQQGFGRRTRI
jgi:uncharacterized membrane protein YhaH (DUF805 family)